MEILGDNEEGIYQSLRREDRTPRKGGTPLCSLSGIWTKKMNNQEGALLILVGEGCAENDHHTATNVGEEKNAC